MTRLKEIILQRPREAQPDKVGRRLKIARIALKKQPVDIAELIGFGANTYSQWEAGKNLPDRDAVIVYVTKEPRLSIDYIYLGRHEGLNDTISGTIRTLEDLDARNSEALNDLDKKGEKRPKPIEPKNP